MEKRAKKPATRTLRQREPRTSEAFVVVYTSSGSLGAEVVKGKLESAGISAMLKHGTAESVFPLTVDGLGEVQVLVHAEDEKKAQRVLKQ